MRIGPMPNDEPKAELATKIADHLRETEGDRLSEEAFPVFSAALAAEHLKLMDEESGKEDPYRVIDPSLTEPGVVYPIHNSELKLMDESTAIAGALWTLTNNPIAVLGKLVALLYRLRRKRARLEGEDALALLALKDAPRRGWTVAQVRDHLKQAFGVT